MIEVSRTSHRTEPIIRILGVGGAGCTVLDRIILDGIDSATAVAINTDVQSLNGSVAPDKIHLGREVTRGLGTGGDPEVGYAAAEEAGEEIQSIIAGANLVFLCAGLGGGTGSGATPLIAHFARKAGATVIVFVTMPFSFEGRRRREQATNALAQIREQADHVICFENDRMGEASAPTAGVQQAFLAADATLSASIRSIAGMVRARGLVGIGLDELATALRQRDSRCLFGHGESDGANRAHEALDRALKSPLMDRGRMLSESHTVLIHLACGTDVTLNEVTVLMEDFNRHISDTTRIQFGLTTDSRLGRKLTVTILSSTSAALASATTHAEAPSRVIAPPQQPAPAYAPPAAKDPHPVEDVTLFPPDEPAFEATPPPVKQKVPVPKSESAVAKAPRVPAEPPAKKEQKAEQMPLEAPSRGRFDKGEPTIVDGQDLDVPTFMRRNVKLK